MLKFLIFDNTVKIVERLLLLSGEKDGILKFLIILFSYAMLVVLNFIKVNTVLIANSSMEKNNELKKIG